MLTIFSSWARLTISAASFTLRNAAGTLAGATVVYNATTRVATLTPTAALTAQTAARPIGVWAENPRVALAAALSTHLTRNTP